MFNDCTLNPTQPTQPNRARPSANKPGFRKPLQLLAASLLMVPSLGYPLAVQANQGQPSISAVSRPIPLMPDASEADGYILGGGDRVKIDFFSVPEFSGEYPVLPNGTINFPQVGAIAVQGLTLKQASELISSRFSDLLQRPIVSISLVAGRPINVVIAGEVNRPGAYNLSLSAQATELTMPTLTRSIRLAEGATNAADLRNVQIRRARPGAIGKYDVFTVNLWELLQNADSRQDVRIRDGDSILIPAASEINLADARLMATANFATNSNRPLKINVIGEVNRPGPYTIAEAQPDNRNNPEVDVPNVQVPSVTKAIQIAGGITQSADLRNVLVRRLTRSGTTQTVKINFWDLLSKGDALQDLPLQDGDTVEIPEAAALDEKELRKLAAASISPNKITVNVVGQVEKPGAVQVPPNTPLNQALLAAGGFNKNARKGSVTLVRLLPNGTVSKREIAIDFAAGQSEKDNPPLRNGDTLVIKKTAFAKIVETGGAALGPLNTLVGIFKLLGL
jgi:polysaccharide biosynthesis/export protein